MHSTSTEQYQPDEALIAGVRRGERDALGELYRRHADSVRKCAQRYARCPTAAADVCQEVFLRLPLAVGGYQEKGCFKGWLLTLTARQALSRLRWSQSRAESSLAVTGRMTHHDDDRVVTRLALQSSMAELPDALRAVFILMKEVQGFIHREIAQRFSRVPL